MPTATKKEPTKKAATKKPPTKKETKTPAAKSGSPKRSPKKVAPKKAATKEATPKEAPPKKPAKKPAKQTKSKNGSTGLKKKQQSVIDYLVSKGATTSSSGVKREVVWKHCKVGTYIISVLKEAGFMCRADLEDGTKEYYLTAKGKSVASK